MERLKDEGQDILKPIFGKPEEASSTLKVTPPPKQEVSMVSATIKRIITAEEFAAHSGAEEPWFAVKGEGTLWLSCTEGRILIAPEQCMTVHHS